MVIFMVVKWMFIVPLTLTLLLAPSHTELIVLPDGVWLEVEVASSPRPRERGLSGREDIGNGMLFCFRDTAIRHFWMYDMRVPLDVVWLRDSTIVGVDEDVPVFTDSDASFGVELEWTQFPSPEPVNAIVELPAGSVAAHSLKVGDLIVGTSCVSHYAFIRRLP